MKPSTSLLIGLLLVPALFAGLSHPMQPDASHAAHETTPYSDRTFLSAMIVHHEDAVAMAKKTLEHKPEPEVATWCRAVVDTQTPEIILMRKLLEPLGGLDKEAAVRETANAMRHSVDGSSDTAFVSAMLAHHKAALDMAGEALLYSDNPSVTALAESIITAQAREMREFKIWLRARD